MNVYIEGFGECYTKMFANRGFVVVDDVRGANLVCFTGGEDVNPKLYGEGKHPTTYYSDVRDSKCQELYEHCISNSIPMVGICRGSQFLCVANGGGLWQHVDGHALRGTHEAYDGESAISVTSTHHQMMRPVGVEGRDFKTLLTAKESFVKEQVVGGEVVKVLSSKPDVEAVLWESTKSFGFQPHPEFNHAPKECTDWFFDKLSLILG